MKPKVLELNAFGPFAGCEKIDFSAFEQEGIFLLTGPTGSGKTTIFDAISFALYGVPSGEGRESFSLKSQHSADEDTCYVRYRFEVGAEEYEIYRAPKQNRYSKRTKGLRTVPESSELIIGKKEVVTGNQSVNERIVQILGIDREQFRQIVMLAQGDFMRLLGSDSKDKEKILRRVFSTERLYRFSEHLREYALDIRHRQEDNLRLLQSVVRTLSAEGNPDLQEACKQEFPDTQSILTLLGEQNKKDEALLTEYNEQISSLASQLSALDLSGARELAARFERRNELASRLRQLQALAPQLEEDRRELERLQRAVSIAGEQIALQKTAAQLEKAVASREEYRRRLAALSPVLKEAAAQYEGLEALRIRAREIDEERLTLQEQLSRLERYESLHVSHQALLKELDISRQQERLLSLLLRRCELLEAARALSREEESCQRLLGLYDQLKKSKERFSRSDRAYKTGYEAFLDAQAGLLARSLAPGVPCPVCGSKEHPAPAAPAQEDVSQEAVEALRRRREEDLAVAKEAQTLLQAGLSGLKENGEADPNDPTPLYDLKAQLQARAAALQEERQALDRSLAALCDPQKLEDPSNRDRESLVSRQSELSSRMAELSARADSAREDMQALEKSLGKLTLQEDCEKKLSALIGEAAGLREKTERITKNHLELISQKQGLEELLSSLQGQIGSLSREEAACRAQYQEALKKSGFADETEHMMLLKKRDQLEELRASLLSRQKERDETAAQHRLLCSQLEGKSPPELAALQKKADELTRKQQELSENRDSLLSRLSLNRAGEAEIRRIAGSSGRLDEQYLDAGALSALVSGNNPHKLTFERYVLGRYFDDILSVANLRLRQMSANRYTFQRRQGRSSYISNTGLEIDILDAYTGKLRAVGTLSGGESFKASLALALGLADVVSHYSGRVNISTIFIDEGFGTLDPQSLESAMETLLSLRQGGRLVGIISHVPELQTMIAQKIVITPSPQGSALQIIS